MLALRTKYLRYRDNMVVIPVCVEDMSVCHYSVWSDVEVDVS